MEKQWQRGPTIGHGSCATVYIAKSSMSGDVFAVKSKEFSQARDLQTEQSILCSLNSPHIVSYLGFDISADAITKQLMYNLFLEYAPGGSLSNEIKRNGGWLIEDKIKSYTCEILHGLMYLHEQGVVHCDIKSQNVLIGSNSCAKIADFGCAKKGFTSKKDHVRGTPIFMAPEVARGEEQGMPADIWALGCTVIEMAKGGSPWDDLSDPISAMHKIGFSEEVPKVPGWLSEEAKDFLSKCFKRDLKERWNAKELLKHPFITSSISKQSSTETWVSPTSNLDQRFWESISSLEGDEEEERDANLSERIKSLIGEFNGEPDWNCDDESWVTVRCNGETIELEETIVTVRCNGETIELEEESIVTSENQEIFLVNERNLERSFVNEISWENERWVGGLDEIVLSENEISACSCDFNFDFDFEHVDCVCKQEIQFSKILSELSVKKRKILHFPSLLVIIKLSNYRLSSLINYLLKEEIKKEGTWSTPQSSI
ncbi:mitogen-activated protein kinase kinase kinase A-like protein [Carex littledalei]|uniref:Mitogen-activated protein kinase kinase kinase A-like protein n=1 Tax=Carex littledalei TaxID=544730 RepID=A0A833QWE4_9POAL|nr:mitogen-activated protein kinase kinase kinase A-like protein [Carex littledalei]